MRKLLTSLIVVLVLFGTVFIQVNVLNIIPLFGVISNFGIVLIVGFGLMSGKLVGGLTGAIYGLLIDIIFSKAIGVNLLLYTLTGIISGQISNKFSKDNRTTFVMVIFVATGLFELTSYGLNSILYGINIAFWKIMMVIVIEMAYNLLITVILYKFIVGLGEFVNKSKNSYYLL